MQGVQKEDRGFFKNWAIPGIRPQSKQNDFSDLSSDQTLDALSGYYRIYQLKDGNRFSTDDLLVAWYGSSWCPSARKVLDLGSGIGSVAMITAWRLTGAHFVTVEAQECSAELARKSVQLNELSDRFDIRLGDLRDESIIRKDEKFDLILGSPPYYPADAGLFGDHPQTVACRFELRGDVSDYCRVASEHLELGGIFVCVFPITPEHQKKRILDAAQKAEMTIVRQRPVVLREGDSPLLGLFVMMRSQDLPEKFRTQTWLEPDLIIRRKDGSVHPEYSAVKLAIGFPP